MYASAWIFTKVGDANGPVAIVGDNANAVEDLLGPPALEPSTPPTSLEFSPNNLEKIEEI